MMELLFRFVEALGPAGFLFLVLMLGIVFGLTQVGRDIIRSIQRKQARAKGDEDPVLFGGIAVMVLSTVIGGVLGHIMLGSVAEVIGIKAGDWAGVQAGLLLGGALTGAVGYLNHRTEQRNLALQAATPAQQIPPDLVGELLSVLATTRVPTGSTYPTWLSKAPEDDAPQLVTDARAALRPATERDVYETQIDEDF